MALSEHARAITAVVVRACEEKLGRDIVVLDVSGTLGIAEVFVMCSGASERQVGAIVDEIEKCSYLAGHKPLYREGGREDSWVLIDFFDVIVHVQHVEARVRYGLDRLWKDCPVVETSTWADVEGS